MSLIQLNDEAHRPIRIAIVNDYPLVIAGTARGLEAYSEQIVIVEYDSQTSVRSEVDIVLYDCFGVAPDAVHVRPDLLGLSAARLVIYSWNTQPQQVAASLKAGAAGVVSKTASPAELVDAIQRVHRGERVTPNRAGTAVTFGRWPGDELGLSSRESEVLALICQGYANKTICETMFLGSNTIKTYIRSLYRKIGVQTRSQAVLWGATNGFLPEKVRVFPH